MSSWRFLEIPHAISRNKAACVAPRFNYDCCVARCKFLTSLPETNQVCVALAMATRQANFVVAAILGVFVRNEFKYVPRRSISSLVLMFVLYVAGLVLLASSRPSVF